MTEVQSDLGKASSLATNLATAASPLSNPSAQTKESKTTLRGNAEVLTTTGKRVGAQATFSTALTRDIQNITSVAKSFEVVNKELENLFHPVLTGGVFK